ncbi:MAG: hypothetical protein NVS4B7_19230 [Ktedonobacteraceae bacterium]
MSTHGLSGRPSDLNPSSLPVPMTGREVEVLKLLTEGVLSLSEDTSRTTKSPNTGRIPTMNESIDKVHFI